MNNEALWEFWRRWASSLTPLYVESLCRHTSMHASVHIFCHHLSVYIHFSYGVIGMLCQLVPSLAMVCCWNLGWNNDVAGRPVYFNARFHCKWWPCFDGLSVWSSQGYSPSNTAKVKVKRESYCRITQALRVKRQRQNLDFNGCWSPNWEDPFLTVSLSSLTWSLTWRCAHLFRILKATFWPSRSEVHILDDFFSHQ